ncbi:MAG: hypothetical protein V1833_07165 [Elusimicrobiota bacterium]
MSEIDALNLSFSSHKAVISTFGKEFSKTDIFDQKFHRAIIDAFDDRQNSDYDAVSLITEDESRDYLNLARKFILEAKKYLKG